MSPEEHQSLVARNQKILDAQLHSDRSCIILSGENISFLSAQSLRRLRSYLNNLQFNIKVIAFVREPLSWTASVAQEHVKHGWNLDDLIEREMPLAARLYERLATLQEVFGEPNVRTVRYEDAPGGDIVGYFAKIARLSTERIGVPIRTNLSLSATSFRLLLEFFKSGVVHDKGRMLEEIRWIFIARLDEIIRATGQWEALNSEAFAQLVDWDDYRRVNELLEHPYSLRENGRRGRQSGFLKSYCEEIDRTQVEDILRSVLQRCDIGPSIDATLEDLVAQLFYQVMCEQKAHMTTEKLKATEQRLLATDQRLSLVEQRLEKGLQSLASSERELARTHEQLDTSLLKLRQMEATRVWKSYQAIVRTSQALQSLIRR